MDILNQFYEISQDSLAYARSWKNETGGKIIGHFCSLHTRRDYTGCRRPAF